MHLEVVKYLEEAKWGDSLKNVGAIFCSLGIAVCLVLFLKHLLMRRKYLNSYPSKKFSFFSVWGHLNDLFTFKHTDVHVNIFFLQLLMAYYQMFKQENFYLFFVIRKPYLIITKAKAVEEIVSGTKHMEKSWIYKLLHRWLGMGLLTSHGSKWKSRRKLLTPSFHFDILKDFLPVFNTQSQLLVKLLKKETEKPWTNFINPLRLCSLDIVCETILGVSIGVQKNKDSEYVKAISRVTESIAKRIAFPPYVLDFVFYLTREGSQFKKDVKLLHDFTRKAISDKKKLFFEINEDIRNRKRKALMDRLLEEHIEKGTLTEEDIREEVDTFAFEGHDTTAAGLNWALYFIGLYKDVQEKVHEELDRIFGDDCERPITSVDLKDMEYLERVLKESQRLYPSVPVIGRTLSEDAVICGAKVPKHFNILILPFILHRDENVFPNPEKFDPDRFLPENTAERSPFAYIPFSAGPRNCIGQRFAMMEMKVVIANILRNYCVESLDERDNILLTIELILRSTGPIRIKLTNRRPTN